MTHIGHATFKGDKLPKGWSVNDAFTVGREYPVYWEFEIAGNLVTGDDGIEYKFVPSAWSKIKELKEENNEHNN